MNTGDNTTAYQVVDELYVWYLADPAQPQLVGQINTTRVTRGVSLRYAPAWLAHGFALSEDLPLQPGDFYPARKVLRPALWTTPGPTAF